MHLLESCASALSNPSMRRLTALLNYRDTIGHRRRSSVNFIFLTEKYVLKISKMPEFYMILARKIIKIPEFLYLPEKLTKLPNFTCFLPQKCLNFT